MKKIDSRGFSIVEGLLIFVIVAVVGATGWYVIKSKNSANKSLDSANNSSNVTAPKNTATTKQPTTTDPTVGWFEYQPPDKVYTIRLADGWKLYHYATGSTKNDLESDYPKEATYKAGTKAAVAVRTEGGRGGLAYFALNYNRSDGYCSPPSAIQSQVKASNGLTGIKYLYDTSKDASYDGLYGPYKSYSYKFTKGDKTVCIEYDATKDDPSSKLDIVEQVVKSLEL